MANPYLAPGLLLSSGVLLGVGGANLTRSYLEKNKAVSEPNQGDSKPSLPVKYDGKLVDSSLPLEDQRNLTSKSLAGPIIGPGGFPGPISDVLLNEAYVSSYDRRLRHPSWTAEHITASSIMRPPAPPSDDPSKRPDRSNSTFKEDHRIPVDFRSKLSDYFRSGYDRGHMVPAADAKKSQTAMDETFYLTNIAPQVGEGFNRDYWAHTEDFCRRLTGKFDDVYVFTVPLYLPKQGMDGKWRVTHEVIGNPPNVSVPTHFAKVILGVGLKSSLPSLPSLTDMSKTLSAPKPVTSFLGLGGGSSNMAMTAFVIPNAIIPDSVPLRSFSVPVESVERSSGLTFFPPALKNSSKHLCDVVSCDLIIRDFSDKNKQIQQQRRNSNST